MNHPGQPPPLPPANHFAGQGVPLRFKELRKNRSFAPGGERYQEVVEAYLPLVVGLAEKMADREVVEQTVGVNDTALSDNQTKSLSPNLQFAVQAVFQVFAAKWKKPSSSVSLASWFWRTTFYVAEAQLGKNGYKSSLRGSQQAGWHLLARRLLKLSPKRQEAALLLKVLGHSPAVVGKSLRTKESRLLKLAASAELKLAARLRKRKFNPLDFPLAAVRAEVPVELVETGVGAATEYNDQSENRSLRKAAVSNWRWFHFFQFVRGVLKGVGITALVLASLTGTFVYLAHNGYLNNFFVSQNARQTAKQFPDLVKPAKPFPDGTNTSAAIRTKNPSSPADLYNPTNIWIASFHFTPEQWKAIAPSNIPSAKLFSNGRINLRNPKAKRSGLSGMVGMDFNYTEAKFVFGDQTFDKVGIRYRGNGTFLNSRYGPKQSFKVDMNEYVKGQKIVGLKTLNFLNCIADDTYMRDVLAQRFFKDLGAIGPRNSYAYLTLDVPGEFDNQPLGLYVLMENIDGEFAEDRFDDKRTPIFKPVTYDLFKDLGPDWSAYAQIYDLKTKASPEQEQRVIDFAKLVTHAGTKEFAEKLPEFLDLEEFAAFLAGHTILSSYDGFLANGQNYYIYLDPKSNRFGFIPWDQDHSWGEFGYAGTAEERERASIWKPSTYENLFLNRVMEVESFQVVYRKKIEEALEKYFIKEKLYAQIDQLAAQIRPAVVAESAFRRRRFDEAISSTWPEERREHEGPPEGPGSKVQHLKRFIENRIKSVRNQLDGKEEGVQLQRDR